MERERGERILFGIFAKRGVFRIGMGLTDKRRLTRVNPEFEIQVGSLVVVGTKLGAEHIHRERGRDRQDRQDRDGEADAEAPPSQPVKTRLTRYVRELFFLF